MALPLPPSPAYGWWEARIKTAMCGLGDAAGAKLGTNPVRTDSSERGKRPGVALPGRRPAGRRAGATPAVGAGSWRSRRSTPRPGKPVTWGRAAA